ncbi:MAG: hypothetical protein FVQ85_12150 [Planctomycetes bacterium]|nr:hypothetical protein [Planctomycetota bacterium]
METDCKFCHEKIEAEAKKCKVCGEPLYFMGRVLKWAPLLSIVATVLSLGLAYFGVNATKRASAVTREMLAKDRGAELALREMAQRVPVPDKDNIRTALHRSGVTLQKLRNEIKKSPGDSDLQRKLFLYRALKKPD